MKINPIDAISAYSALSQNRDLKSRLDVFDNDPIRSLDDLKGGNCPQSFRENLSQQLDSEITEIAQNQDWIGIKLRDRVEQRDAVITGYNPIDKTTTLKFFDNNEIRILPHFRNPNQDQPYGAFYTQRYWDGKVKK